MRRMALGLFGTGLGVVLTVRAASPQQHAAPVPDLPPQPPTVEFKRSSEVGGVLPASAAQYAAIDPKRLVQLVEEVCAISRRYRDSGHPQFWGRIMGTESDEWNAQWLMAKYREFGLADVRQQPIDMPPQWMPQSWAVSAAAGDKAVQVPTAQPTYASPGTASEGLDLEAVYVGMGSDADLALSRDVRGKAVFFYSADLTARFAGMSDNAFRRLSERGAAAIFAIVGLPGNVRVQMYPVNSTVPSFTVGQQDGLAVRDLIAFSKTPVRVRVRLDVKMVPNLKTSTVWGTLPGATDETIWLAAHRDGWWEAASDNASGVAAIVALAEYYSKVPQAKRRRTIHFIGSSGHHTPAGVSGEWFQQHPERFKKAALIMNAEHTGARQTYHGSMRPANAPAVMRWFANDARMANIVTNALDLFGIASFYESDPRAAGETGRYYHYAPSAQVLSYGYVFHTDRESPAEGVSGPGMAATTRLYAKIIDEVNAIDLKELRATLTVP